MRFAVLGVVGVGGLLGALLARGGDSVVFLHDRAPHEIRVESQRFGDFSAAVQSQPVLEGPVDAVLVTVKATQLDDALLRVPASEVGDAAVIPFLNGLEHIERLRGVYGASVRPATIAVESTRVAPGVIQQTSPFTFIQMTGPQAVADRFKAAGIDVRMRDDEMAMLWDKYAILAPMALLTTHARANIGSVRSQRRDEIDAVVDEFIAVAAADGVTIERATVMRMVDGVPDAFETSMQRDDAAGRPTEVDALGGAMLRRAAKAGIEVPVTTKLVDEIRTRSPLPASPAKLGRSQQS